MRELLSPERGPLSLGETWAEGVVLAVYYSMIVFSTFPCSIFVLMPVCML